MDFSSKLIDGKKVSLAIQESIQADVQKMLGEGKRAPHLAAVLVGNDGGSETYVASKIKTCEKIGFGSSLFRFSDTVSETELLEKIHAMNEDKEIDGFIVQLPLPKHISVDKVIETIHPAKDVDGFHPQNVGRLMLGLPTYISATPFGIMKLLEYYKIETSGKHCVVLGRSNIVGTPVSLLMSRNTNPGNATVTLCHSKTRNLEEITRSADIVIAALGIPEFVKGNMVKDGAVIIDVGTTRVASPETKSGFRLKGDVLFNEVAPKASMITPVPGGVGPMTIASLMQNTLKAARKEIYRY
jgi:methylenetetrahydrofolate dehydrogenase (NADP+)/methenyltetrahydrofolate cyclohydrolase